ncbi:iron complex outermembrane receptor protein [Anseongella ginsenosidimutans]|uniref:Iron complex outermembrane receptor protein n=1 Tax=Anseongella ginsenosidimutans TaxID=496056 RepID=A0A4R3KWP2_9SPHI|nr:TonB-dependent receptor [Anseongella ginsenosidimutans]QEC51564.1 TonB-dependent receptor [Anseongella ginsenosidimutans]TCS88890.1 iron complex outermembrane receptor protein [Anseongella ginsenosidimutans]
MKILFPLAILLGAIFTAQGQTGTVAGTVSTAEGRPAPNVSLSLENTYKRTATNANGEFRLSQVKAGDYIIVATYAGIETRQSVHVDAGELTTVEIILRQYTELDQVVVEADAYKEEGEYVAKMPLERIENPQVYHSIGSGILEAQLATDFDKALKNAPGLQKMWESTGRGGDGAGYYSMRGFAVQPTLVNGLPGLTNGSLDPANIESIQVIKGPSGTLFGSSLISYGGLINTVTKKPYQGFGGEAAYVAGSFGLNRITADVNAPLNKANDIIMRVNTAFHSENSFQDAGFKRSFFLAPSLSYEVNERLSFLLSAELLTAEGTNPTMLFLNRSGPLQYENLADLNYDPDLSLTSNDITIKNPRYNVQTEMIYQISPEWTSQTVVSRGFAKSDGYYSYLWDNGYDKPQFSVFISDQNAHSLTTDIQQNFTGDFRIGGLRNRLVVGLDYFHRQTHDFSSGYPWFYDVSPRGEIDYVDPYTGETVAPRYLTKESVDAVLASSSRANLNTKDETYSIYFSDVINITPELLAMASLRLDHFNTKGDVSTDEDDYEQTALSPKFGLVYQPIPNKLSVFANYMNGFKNVAPATVSDINGENPVTKTFEPEHANQAEFGIKTDLFEGRLSSTISVYDIKVSNKVMPDPANINNSLQGGEIESKGLEVDLNLRPVPGLSILAGYSYNDSKVLRGIEESAFEEAGKRPGEAGPKNLFNAWATYEFSKGALRGWGLGFGANSASELIILDSRATGKFTVPGYTVLDASVFYNTEKFRITLKLDNLSNEEYYTGWSTINPQRPRSFAAGLTYRF